MLSPPWLIGTPGDPHRFRLYCFCYAGGNATSFLPWQAHIDKGIEVVGVQLPGRGARFVEAPCSSWTELIFSLAEVLVKQEQKDFAFFGHSLGGLIAFELARHCASNGLPLPRQLIISGCDAPQKERTRKNLHQLDDEALIEELRNYNGTPAEVLAHRELMTLLLPTIRSDFALGASYTYDHDAPLDIPITVLAGSSDIHTSAETLQLWKRETTKDFCIHWFSGDHFFIDSEQRAVLDCISNELHSATLQYGLQTSGR